METAQAAGLDDELAQAGGFLGAGDDPHALFRQFPIRGERVHVVGGVQRLKLGRGQVVGDLVHGIPGMSGQCPGRCMHAGPGTRITG